MIQSHVKPNFYPQTYRDTLEQFPETLLGSDKVKHYFNDVKKEYFFDRNQIAFPGVLYYYQSGGRIYIPNSVPSAIYFQELDFFKIPYKSRRQKKEPSVEPEDNRPTAGFSGLRYRIWDFLDKPESSSYSRIWALFDVLIILLSIVTVILESMPQLKSVQNVNTFSIIDTMCVAFFTFDFFLRSIICPSKIAFAKTPLNWLDFLAILPFYMELAVGKLLEGSAITTFKVLRIFRIMRVMKLIRHSKRLILMGKVSPNWSHFLPCTLYDLLLFDGRRLDLLKILGL